MTDPSHPSPDEALIEELEQAWNNLQGERWNIENAVALACAVKPRLPRLLVLAREASEAKARLERLEIRRREGRHLLQKLVKYSERVMTPGGGQALVALCAQVADYLNRTHEPSDILRGTDGMGGA